MDQWKSKNAVVTGAGSGIGAATTVELLRHGVNVVGLDVRSAKLEVVFYFPLNNNRVHYTQ